MSEYNVGTILDPSGIPVTIITDYGNGYYDVIFTARGNICQMKVTEEYLDDIASGKKTINRLGDMDKLNM